MIQWDNHAVSVLLSHINCYVIKDEVVIGHKINPTVLTHNLFLKACQF